jgi:hypothetical protein
MPINPDRQLKKEQGFMVFGLKSHIKALEMAEGHKKSQGKYRYVVADDASSARIINAADESTVPCTDRTRQEWARIGRPARLASIALKAAKDEMESQGRVEYTFDVTTGDAYLTVRGQRVLDRPTTIEDWAKIGAPLEKALFEQLTVARDYGNVQAEAATRQKMERYGVIRKPRAA